MRHALCMLLCLIMCGCVGARTDIAVMNKAPNFYIYGGEAGTDVLDTVRACGALGAILTNHGQEILVVKVDPPLPVGALFQGPSADVIGLASRSTLFKVGEFGGSSAAEPVAWKVEEKGDGQYTAVSSIGIV